MHDKRNFSVAEYCQRYGYSRSLAYKDLKAGVLRHIKVGDRTLIPLEFAEELQRKRMQTALESDPKAA